MDRAGAMFSIVLIFFALFIHGNFCDVLDDEEFDIGDGLEMRIRVLNGSEMIDTLRELGFNEEADEMEDKTINDGQDNTSEKSGFETNLINDGFKNQQRDLDNIPLVPTTMYYKNIGNIVYEMEDKTINDGQDYTFEKSGFETNLINDGYKNQQRDLDNIPLVPTTMSYKNIRNIVLIGVVVLLLFILVILYIFKLMRERSNDLNQYQIDKKKLISASVYQV